MEKNKWTLVTIVILLLVFIPCTIIGMMKRFEEVNKEHNFYYEGELYFYTGDRLVGKYTCKTDKCDYAEYQEIDTGNMKKTSMINNKYAFIKDGEKIYLYDIEAKINLIEYQELKGYSIPILNDSYITKVNEKWGVISVSPSLYPALKNVYDEVTLNYNINLDKVNLEKMIVKDGDSYKIISNNEEIYLSPNQIIECNDVFVVILLEDGTYQILSYENEDYFSTDIIISYSIINNYLVIWSVSGLDIYIIDNELEYPFNYLETYSASADVKLEEGKLNVYEDGQIINTYEKIIEN